MKNQQPIAFVTYVDIERVVGYEEVEIVHHRRTLELFDDELVTSGVIYPLANVWDISWKSFSDDSGLLYLHTNQGVITYKIQKAPDSFIKAFRQLKGRL